MIEHQKRLAYQLAFMRSQTPTALVAKDGSFMAVNQAYSRLVEYSEFELMKRSFQVISDPDDVENDQSEAERVAEGKIESYEMIKSYITKTKRVIKVRLRVDGVRDETGAFVCFVAQATPLHTVVNKTLTKDAAIVDIRVVKFITYLQKNHKTVLFILTGLAMLGYFMKEFLKLK